MQTIPYTEIDTADESDVGRVAIMHVGGPVLAIADTVVEALKEASVCAGETITTDDVDAHTDHASLTTEDIVAVLVGSAGCLPAGRPVCRFCGEACGGSYGPPCKEAREEQERLNKLISALETFKDKLLARLMQKMHQGYNGWDDPAYRNEWAKRALEHATRAASDKIDAMDAVDAAAFFMMVDYLDSTE